MVDAIVGIVILGLVAGSVAGAFSTLSRLDLLQEKRIDQLVKESDAATRSDWY